MKPCKTLLSLVLLIFSGLSFWGAGVTSSGALQILGDLTICIGLLVHWMVGDARRRCCSGPSIEVRPDT